MNDTPIDDARHVSGDQAGDVARLVEELRNRAGGLDRLLNCSSIPSDAMRRAADELARVAMERDAALAEIARLRETLKQIESGEYESGWSEIEQARTIARAALETKAIRI